MKLGRTVIGAIMGALVGLGLALHAGTDATQYVEQIRYVLQNATPEIAESAFNQATEQLGIARHFVTQLREYFFQGIEIPVREPATAAQTVASTAIFGGAGSILTNEFM